LLLWPLFAGAQLIILSEDFETAFPGIWTTGNTGSGPTWRDVNSFFGGEGTHSGNWKGYCAGTAYPFGSTEPSPTYTNSMAAYMETEFNLRGCENLIVLRFWSKIPSIESCCDAAKVFANGILVWSNATPQAAWTEVTVDLSGFVGGLCALRFEFDSDSSITAEGWYLDDISVVGYDTIPPSVTCPPSLVLNTDPGQCSRSNVTFTATPSDDCPGATVSCVPPSGSTFPAGVTTVTCKATDAAGNTNQCTFTVTVADTPVIVCPSNIVALTCSNSARVEFDVTASNSCFHAGGCLVPDNGSGTANLPPQGCEYTAPFDVMRIIDGLPPGTTIDMPPVLRNFTCPGSVSVCSFATAPGDCADPGGALGGEKTCVGATLALDLIGTGTLAGFNRAINVPVGLETHLAPRTNGTPVQSFDADLFRFFGQITGDPDFDLLRITGGTDFGLPSPGHTTLTQQPGGNWAVDSFFDITYRIDFVGASGGALAGRSGSTTGTIRINTGNRPPVVTCSPPSGSFFPLGTNLVTCVASNIWGRSNSCNFTVTVASDTRPPMITCPSNIVVQTCSNSFPVEFFVIASNDCGYAANCALPDNGGGTANLPPAGCQYVAPFDVMYIVDGLPPGTTIKMPPILGNFTCNPSGVVCSFPTSPGDCADPGGWLGGEKVCSDATLALTLIGTGTLSNFNRAINVPVGLEIHLAPRTPYAPVQNFATDLFRFFGQIVMSDPDFDLLRIVGGTDFGLPSPGHTTLTQQPGGTWAVDSFFDITYRVDFVGAPGGALAGMSGSTTATIRLRTGAGLYPNVVCTPASSSQFPLGTNWVTCVATNQWGSNVCNFQVTVNATRPTLLVNRQGTNVLLRWPEACSTYQLQATPTLTPPVPWTNLPTPPAHVGAEWQVLVSPPPSNQFFRLKLLP